MRDSRPSWLARHPWPARLVPLASLLMAAGCSSLIDVRPLATGRVDVAAFELRGPSLQPLRREALRLCPQGADVLRQTVSDQRPELDAGRIHRWLNTAAAWVEPPVRQAQLMVVCKATGVDLALAAPEAPAASAVGNAGASEKPSDSPASEPVVPIGPILPEW